MNLRTQALALLFVSAIAPRTSEAEPVTQIDTKNVAPAPDSRRTVPFIEDDYPKALALARARKVPLFIESWAPW